MANETNILGVIEVYSKVEFEKLKQALSADSFNNMFNVAVCEAYLNNRGSILIPFAKCFRSELDDDDFIGEHVKAIIKQIEFVEMFSIEVFTDSVCLHQRRYVYLVGDGKLSLQKFSIDFVPIEK